MDIFEKRFSLVVVSMMRSLKIRCLQTFVISFDKSFSNAAHNISGEKHTCFFTGNFKNQRRTIADIFGRIFQITAVTIKKFKIQTGEGKSIILLLPTGSWDFFLQDVKTSEIPDIHPMDIDSVCNGKR